MYKLIYLARRNPNVSRENWPETWRSHATFASQFAVLRGMKYSRYCNRIDTPMLGGRPVDLPGVSTAHDGIAIACTDSIELIQGGGFTTKQRALIQHDELRVFDRLTPDFSFHCIETPIRDGSLGEAAVFRFLARKPEVTRMALKERLTGEHSRVVHDAIDSLDTITRYTLNFPLHRPLPHFPFDAISECWYAGADDAVRSLSESRFAAVEHDLAEFCQMEPSIVLLTEVCSHWHRQ